MFMYRSRLRTLSDLFNVLPCEHVVVTQPAPIGHEVGLPDLAQLLGVSPNDEWDYSSVAAQLSDEDPGCYSLLHELMHQNASAIP